MSTFGTYIKVTTAGESHAKGIVAIIDGIPPQISLTEKDIQTQLTRRRPGQSSITTSRDEKDAVQILCGTENGYTLGTPIALLVPNRNIRPLDYKKTNSIPRPGHADYTYQIKYGIRASSGGGRSSARETIARVATGTIVEKWLSERFGIEIVCWVSSGGDIRMPHGRARWTRDEVDSLGTLTALDPASGADYFCEGIFYKSDGTVTNSVDSKWFTDDIIHVRCPDTPTAVKIAHTVKQVKGECDSMGGTVTCVCKNVPTGMGEPCFDKMEALLAHAMLSIPATKGFEIGSGFAGTRLRGSEHNDLFVHKEDGFLKTDTNHAGGTLGGITSGQDIVFRVAVKPVSTIGKAQETLDFEGNATVLEAKGRHDPYVLPRIIPIVESMTALVLGDMAMCQLARSAAILENM